MHVESFKTKLINDSSSNNVCAAIYCTRCSISRNDELIRTPFNRALCTSKRSVAKVIVAMFLRSTTTKKWCCCYVVGLKSPSNSMNRIKGEYDKKRSVNSMRHHLLSLSDWNWNLHRFTLNYSDTHHRTRMCAACKKDGIAQKTIWLQLSGIQCTPHSCLIRHQVVFSEYRFHIKVSR